MLSCGAWKSAMTRALTTVGSTIGCSVPVIIIININTIAIIIVVAVIILINQTMQCTLHSILILMHSANTHCKQGVPKKIYNKL